MKIAHINMVCEGSTGTIMLNIAEKARKSNLFSWSYSAYPYSKQYNILQSIPFHSYYGTYAERHVTNLLGRVFGMNGLSMRHGTVNLVKELKKNDVNILHLHNLHNYCIHFPTLLKYIKGNNVKVVWTLHDCWTFTGHCAHFVVAKCNKWKTKCYGCSQIREYPQSLIDSSRIMYKLKKTWFTSIDNLTLVTPSQWLADLVKQSYLKDYPVKVIHNGIDLNVFKPTPSDFRQRHGILESKAILLGVAFGWGQRKGLDVFMELSKRLDSDKYQIVLVGTDDSVDKQLPENIISIHRTHNQTELAEIYTAADLFVNPTREENYPTVNMESIACGTPVLTFRTGGSPEILDETSGSVVDCDDIDAMEREIVRICAQKPYSVESCLNRAKQFDMNDRFEEYIKLYEQVGN